MDAAMFANWNMGANLCEGAWRRKPRRQVPQASPVPPSGRQVSCW
jgi:hypothetical protein